MKKIWSFSGGKGGVGKTFIVSSLGILLAKAGHDVVLVDGNIGLANLHTALGIKKPSTSPSDIPFKKNSPIKNIIHDTSIENLRLICVECDPFTASDSNSAIMSRLTTRLRDVECDYLLIDVGSATSANAIDLFLMADVGALVTTPEPASIELTYRFIKTVVYQTLVNSATSKVVVDHINDEMLGSDSGNIIEIVRRILKRISAKDKATHKKAYEALANLNLKLLLNMGRGRKDQTVGPSICEVVRKFYGFDLEFPGYIPFDETVSIAVKQGEPFVIRNAKSDTAACLGLIMKSIVDSGESDLSSEDKSSQAKEQLDLIRS